MSQARRKTRRNAKKKVMAPETNCGAGSSLIVVRRPPSGDAPVGDDLTLQPRLGAALRHTSGSGTRAGKSKRLCAIQETRTPRLILPRHPANASVRLGPCQYAWANA